MGSPSLDYSSLEHHIRRAMNLWTRDFRKAYFAVIGADLERACNLVSALVREEIPESNTGLVYYGALAPLWKMVMQRCLLFDVANTASEGAHSGCCNMAFKVICDTLSRIRYSWPIAIKSSCDTGWPFKISGPAARGIEKPVDALMVFARIVRKQHNATDDVYNRIIGVYYEFDKAKSSPNIAKYLVRVGPTVLSYWLSLTYSDEIPPFDPPVYCRFFDENCEDTFLNNRRAAAKYHAELTKTILQIIKKHRLIDKHRDRLKDRKVHNMLELHTALSVELCIGQEMRSKG